MNLFDELKSLTSPGAQAKPAPTAVVETPAQSAILSGVSESAPTTATVPAESVAASSLPVVDVMSQADIDAAMKQAVLVVPAPISPKPTAVSSVPDGEGMTPRELDAARKLADRQAVLAQVVPVLPEPASVPLGKKVFDETHTLIGYLTPDGKFAAKSDAQPDDLFASISDADKAPWDDAIESRLDLPGRSAGRVAFLLATREKNRPELTALRQRNDLGRELYHRTLTAKPFDPETSANADKIKRFIS